MSAATKSTAAAVQPLCGIECGAAHNTLPDPFRRELGHALRASRGDWGGPRERLRAQRSALAAALTAEPYDPAAVARVLDAETDPLTGLADRGSGLLLAQIARMTPDQHRVYAEALAHGPERAHHRRPWARAPRPAFR